MLFRVCTQTNISLYRVYIVWYLYFRFSIYHWIVQQSVYVRHLIPYHRVVMPPLADVLLTFVSHGIIKWKKVTLQYIYKQRRRKETSTDISNLVSISGCNCISIYSNLLMTKMWPSRSHCVFSSKTEQNLKFGITLYRFVEIHSMIIITLSYPSSFLYRMSMNLLGCLSWRLLLRWPKLWQITFFRCPLSKIQPYTWLFPERRKILRQ